VQNKKGCLSALFLCPGTDSILKMQEQFFKVCPGTDSILKMQEQFFKVCPGTDSILKMQEQFLYANTA